MMNAAYQAALSGLQAFGTRIQSNANNIANANSEGFKKTRVTLAETLPQGVRAAVEKVETPGAMVFEETGKGMDVVELSNVELGSELPEMMLNSQFYKANLKTIETVDRMTGTLLAIKS
jgi:flagellar basal-body rod protein FlgC